MLIKTRGKLILKKHLTATIWKGYISSMKKITILIKNEQYRKLLERAKKIETTMSEQIRKAIEKYLEKVKK